MVAWRLAKSTEESLNSILAAGGDIIDFSQISSNKNIWNATLIEAPKFSEDYISFILDGSFKSVDSIIRGEQGGASVEPVEFPKMPIFIHPETEKRTVQMQSFISEFTINQAMLTLYENHLMIKGLRVSSTYVKTFISNFEEVFGKHQDVFLLLEAMAPPQLTITESVSKVTADVHFQMKNPLNEEFDAVEMKF